MRVRVSLPHFLAGMKRDTSDRKRGEHSALIRRQSIIFGVFPYLFLEAKLSKEKMKSQSVCRSPPLVSLLGLFSPVGVGLLFVSPNFAAATFSSLPCIYSYLWACLFTIRSSMGHGRWLRFRIIDANAKSLNGAVNYVLLCNKVNHKNAAIN